MAVYQPDYEGFTRLATSRRVSRHMVRVVGRHWANELRAIAGEVFQNKTPDYANSISVEPVTVTLIVDGRPLPRAAVCIAANAPHATILEVGSPTILVPPRPLTKVLDRIEDADPGQLRKNRG